MDNERDKIWIKRLRNLNNPLIMVNFKDLSLEELDLISHALYQTYSNMTLVPKNRLANKYNDAPNALQRRINQEIKIREGTSNG